LLKVFLLKNAVLGGFFKSKSKSFLLLKVVFLCILAGRDFQVANRSTAEEGGAVTGSPPCFLLVAWELYTQAQKVYSVATEKKAIKNHYILGFR
jgi:hypothetical protein